MPVGDIKSLPRLRLRPRLRPKPKPRPNPRLRPKPNPKPRLTRERFDRDFSDFFQTYSNFLPMVGVLKPRQAFFLLTLLCGDRAQNVVFGVKIRVQRNGHNFLWLKAFSITLFACYRG